MSWNLPDDDTLRKLLRYDADTITLFWRHRDRSLFICDADFEDWNKSCADQPVKWDTGFLVGYFGREMGYSTRSKAEMTRLIVERIADV